MSTLTSNGSQSLTPKELTLFKKILKAYEQKQYKIGLRHVKQILSNPNFLEHGETLSMKGLILNCMGRHAEAMEVVKRGLRADLKSHICWHVYGLVQRSDKNYDDAMKAYKSALRIDSDNSQILRDLSLLQIQMRDLEGYRESRHRILVARPTNRMGWMGYATACHLVGDYDMALSVLKEYKKNNRPVSQNDFDNSELVLYEVMILRDAGRMEQALTCLEENAVCVVDRLSYMEIRAEILVKLGRLEDAENVYWTLLNRNPDNVYYYKQLEKCKKIASDDNVSKTSIYQRVLKTHPKASIPQLFTLYCLEGKEFEKGIFAYLTANFRRGVPSLFKNVLPIYLDESKVNTIEKMLLDIIRLIEKNGYNNWSFDVDWKVPESPATVLWVYYYLAQHFDRLKQFPNAHKYIDEALKHTPTLIELYMTKAKILKHESKIELAAQWMVDAQEMDTADRYINSKCAKYLLRAGKMEEAEAMCAKFTREGVNASDNLNEMQCMWYELECAKTYYAMKKYGEALKKCHQIERHFVDFYEDHYDFHSYCIRKMTLCSYIKTVRLEDSIRNEEHYLAAAKIASKIYLEMLNAPANDVADEKDEKLSAAELKKQRRKANKAKATEEKKNVTQTVVPLRRRIDGELDVVPPEPLDPQKLLNPEDPAEEAAKFIRPLLYLPCADAEIFLLGFDVYCHKKKHLLMLHCLKKASELNAKEPKIKTAFTKYLEKYNESELSGTVGELVAELTAKFKEML